MSRYRWFVDPDEHTNRVLSQILPPENAREEVKVMLSGGDGVLRNLWECDRHILQKLERSTDRRLGYKVFVQRGNGQIREWVFAERKTRSHTQQRSPAQRQPVVA